MRTTGLLIGLLTASGACSSKAPSSAEYALANGARVDCAALKALPPGKVLAHLTGLTRDVGDGQAALEHCLADGPHLCDRAWVGWAMFGGASMAVVDGVAPPIDQRARWFGEACRAMPAAEQGCLLMSRRMARGPQPAGAVEPCDPVAARMRAALSAAQRGAAQ